MQVVKVFSIFGTPKVRSALLAVSEPSVASSRVFVEMLYVLYLFATTALFLV
jgi:hypothetical protein